MTERARRTISAATLALALGLLLPPARAQAESAPTRLTLAEALSRAEAGNPELLSGRERAAGEAERAESVRRVRWPRASVQLGWSRTDTPALAFAHKLNSSEFSQADFAIPSLNDPAALSHLESVLQVELPIDVFGAIAAGADARAAGARAASSMVREATQELRYRVVEAYRGAYLAERSLAVVERALAGARGREAEIQARVGEGASLHADLLRARARRREREADLAARRADVEVALAGLGRLLGASAAERLIAAEGPPAMPAPDVEGSQAWLERAARQRASAEVAAFRAEAAAAALRGEQRGRLPQIGVYGQLRDDRIQVSDGGQSWTIGAAARFDLFDGTRARREAAAAADERAARLEARAAADQIRLEVESAWRRAVAARERVRAAGGGAEEGREALRVVRERRAAGLATLTDELETEAAALGAELEELRAVTAAALADAALRRAAGEL
ncbi:MAG: TolC family protein [Vicinamibacteria bacterium]